MTDNNAVVAATSTKIEIFNNPSFGNIRTFVDVKGEPWFCGKDVASSLGYVDETKALSQHCRQDGVAKHPLIDSLGREQDTTFINEGNLYRLIMRSKLPSAEKFESWVVDEVLPTLRKTGSYSLVETPMERLMRNSTNQLETATALVEILKVEAKKQEALTTEVKQLTSTVKTQNVQIAEMQPKVQYCDIVLSCPDVVTVTVIAKDYGKSAMWLNNYLKDKKIIFKQGDIWLPYQKYAQLGLTKTKTSTYKDNKGNEHAKTHSYWTQKGRLFIYDLLKQDNIFPLIEQE